MPSATVACWQVNRCKYDAYAGPTEDTSVLLADTDASSSGALPKTVCIMQLRNYNTKKRNLKCLDKIIFLQNIKLEFHLNDSWRKTYLFVKHHIDDGVEQGWGLCEKGRNSHGLSSESSSLVEENPASKTGIGGPSNQEATNHQDAHTCHFPLCLLGGGWVLLLGCSLLVRIRSR